MVTMTLMMMRNMMMQKILKMMQKKNELVWQRQ
jgi:hypothetical protein